MTVYDYDLHDIGQSAFQSFQRQALAERSLADDVPAPAAATAAPSPPPARTRATGGGLLKKLAIGAAVVGATAGVIYLGRCAMSDRKA